MTTALAMPARRPTHDLPDLAARRDSHLRALALIIAVALHGGVFAALAPMFQPVPMVDTTPLIVSLLDAPVVAEAPPAAEPQLQARPDPQPAPARRPQPSRTLPAPSVAMPPSTIVPPPMPEPPPAPQAAAPAVPPAPAAPAAPPATPAAPALTQSTVESPAMTAVTVPGPVHAAAAPTTDTAPIAPQPVIPPRFDADYLANPAPAYPATSRRLGEEGRVILEVRVSADGAPLAVEVNKSSGWPRLDEAALTTVRHWRFMPARLGDKAVIASVLVPLSFSLDD